MSREITLELPDDEFGDKRWPSQHLALYRRVQETRHYILCAPLSYATKDGRLLLVKPGFRTDGASVPRMFWWYASPFSGAHAAAAVLHDALYAAKITTRQYADDLFHEALGHLPVRKQKAWAMYRSVRLAGSIPWNNKTDEEKALARQLVHLTEGNLLCSG